MAFLVCVGFGVYGALQKLLYCVPAPLNAALYALGISEQDVFDTSNIGCYLPVV